MGGIRPGFGEGGDIVSEGLFISLDGPEASGKSTQVTLLSEALGRRGVDVVTVREPGGTPLGEQIRKLVKHFGSPGSVCPEAELLLFGASRAQLVREVIEPHLRNGGAVICDRFGDSTTVYQGIARDLDRDFIQAMHALTIGSCWPDVTVIIDVDESTSRSRRLKRDAVASGARDRFECESDSFHRSVRDGFLRLAAEDPGRISVVSGCGTCEEVHGRIMEVVEGAIRRLA